jgi:hypothetical protein
LVPRLHLSHPLAKNADAISGAAQEKSRRYFIYFPLFLRGLGVSAVALIFLFRRVEKFIWAAEPPPFKRADKTF